VVTGRDPHGHAVPLTIVELDETNARLDANHPFAGKDLVMDVTVVTVETATPEELAHGHSH
jgi:FKBP-type peptidyl-prolyl cis-trans isomerase SlyD